MAIEWLIGLDCAPKQTLGVEPLVSKLKARRQAESLLEMVRAQGDTRDPRLIALTTVRTGPDGSQAQSQVSLAELLATGEELKPHAGACDGCPANQLYSAFGCYGSIAYPIRRDTELWLLSLLPDDLHTTAGTFLLNAIADFKYDGAPVKALRNGTHQFFESDEPSAVSWDDGTSIDADQLFQMLFFVGPLQPAHATMLALFLGIVPHASEPDELRAVLRDPGKRQALFGNPRLPGPPGTAGAMSFDTSTPGMLVAPQIMEFRTFLGALCRAVLLDVPLEVDA